MDVLPIDVILEKEAFDDSGRRIGLIEAVGIGRGRVARRVGVRVQPTGPALKFYSLAGARLDQGKVILAVHASPAESPVPRLSRGTV